MAWSVPSTPCSHLQKDLQPGPPAKVGDTPSKLESTTASFNLCKLRSFGTEHHANLPSMGNKLPS